MSHYLIQEVEATPNVEVRTGTTVVGGGGDGRLQQLVLRERATGAEETVAADALFVLIGRSPAHRLAARGHRARLPTGSSLTGDDLPDDAAGRSSAGRSRSRPACPACSRRATSGMAR